MILEPRKLITMSKEGMRGNTHCRKNHEAFLMAVPVKSSSVTLTFWPKKRVFSERTVTPAPKEDLSAPFLGAG